MTHLSTFQLAEALAESQVANDIKRQEHEPLGNIRSAPRLVLLADTLDGEAHLAVDAGQEGLEARLGHWVREQALVLAVDLGADLVEDAGRVGDEQRVEGRLEEAALDAVDALACRRVRDVYLVRADAHRWSVLCVERVHPVWVVRGDDEVCRDERGVFCVPWPWDA